GHFLFVFFFFFQAEDGIRDRNVTGVQTCALPISRVTSFASFIFLAPVSSTSNTIGIVQGRSFDSLPFRITFSKSSFIRNPSRGRSEEHTSELQSRFDLVCRLLLEKKKQKKTITMK